MTDDRMHRLAVLAGVMRDAALVTVAREAQACAVLRARLVALEASLPPDPVVDPAALEAAALRHAQWAAGRRRQLNEQLALAKAAHLQAQEKARIAFARAQVLDGLVRRSR
jgi:hypothetical protein